MPAVPQPLPPAVGFPTESGIIVSKSDWAVLVARDVEIRAWMQAAVDCMRAR
jgi:hypothetical protein